MPNSDNELWTIGQMAKHFDVTARALRFYEDKNMLHPKRDGLARFYGPRDRARLKLILRGKLIGLPLDDIAELIDLYDVDKEHRVQLRCSLEKFEAQSVVLRKQRAALDEAIAMLDDRIGWMREELAKPPVSSEDAQAYEKVAQSILGRTSFGANHLSSTEPTSLANHNQKSTQPA